MQIETQVTVDRVAEEIDTALSNGMDHAEAIEAYEALGQHCAILVSCMRIEAAQPQRHAPTTGALWASNRGRVVCDEHGGAAFTAYRRAHPRARKFITELEAWQKLTADEISDPEWIAEFGGPVKCEACP